MRNIFGWVKETLNPTPKASESLKDYTYQGAKAGEFKGDPSYKGYDIKGGEAIPPPIVKGSSGGGGGGSGDGGGGIILNISNQSLSAEQGAKYRAEEQALYQRLGYRGGTDYVIPRGATKEQISMILQSQGRRIPTTYAERRDYLAQQQQQQGWSGQVEESQVRTSGGMNVQENIGTRYYKGGQEVGRTYFEGGQQVAEVQPSPTQTRLQFQNQQRGSVMDVLLGDEGVTILGQIGFSAPSLFESSPLIPPQNQQTIRDTSMIDRGDFLGFYNSLFSSPIGTTILPALSWIGGRVEKSAQGRAERQELYKMYKVSGQPIPIKLEKEIQRDTLNKIIGVGVMSASLVPRAFVSLVPLTTRVSLQGVTQQIGTSKIQTDALFKVTRGSKSLRGAITSETYLYNKGKLGITHAEGGLFTRGVNLFGREKIKTSKPFIASELTSYTQKGNVVLSSGIGAIRTGKKAGDIFTSVGMAHGNKKWITTMGTSVPINQVVRVTPKGLFARQSGQEAFSVGAFKIKPEAQGNLYGVLGKAYKGEKPLVNLQQNILSRQSTQNIIGQAVKISDLSPIMMSKTITTSLSQVSRVSTPSLTQTQTKLYQVPSYLGGGMTERFPVQTLNTQLAMRPFDVSNEFIRVPPISQVLYKGRIDTQLRTEPITKLRTDTLMKTGVLTKTRTDTLTKVRTDTLTKLKINTLLKTKVRSDVATKMRMNTLSKLRSDYSRPMRYPSINIKIPFPKEKKIIPFAIPKGSFFPTQSFGKYPVLVRRFGKFRVAGYGKTPSQAFNIGSNIVSKTLARSFTIPNVKPSNIFGYKTKKTKEGIIFIEPSKRALSTPSELKEIKYYRAFAPKRKKKNPLDFF